MFTWYFLGVCSRVNEMFLLVLEFTKAELDSPSLNAFLRNNISTLGLVGLLAAKDNIFYLTQCTFSNTEELVMAYPFAAWL